MNVDKVELRRLADAAVDDFGAYDPSDSEQEFMSRINPSTVLALLDECDSKDADISACKDHPGGCGYWREAARLREAERDAALAEIDALRQAVDFAAKSLAQITSSDGSGHADIALTVLRIAGIEASQREALVDDWQGKAQWRIDAAMAHAKENGDD